MTHFGQQTGRLVLILVHLAPVAAHFVPFVGHLLAWQAFAAKVVFVEL